VAISCTPEAGDTNSTYLRQAIGNLNQLCGKTVTLSAKLKNVTVNGDPRLIIYYETGSGSSSRAYTTITAAKANTIISVTKKLPSDLTVLHVEIGNDANSGGDGSFDIEIESVKLEMGSVSTLANDAPPRDSDRIMESAEKTGHYYRMISGGKEWINPPMTLDTEYRIAERWNGKVCYCKWINVGSMPNASAKTVSLSGATAMYHVDGFISKDSKYYISMLTPNSSIDNIYFSATEKFVSIQTTADMSTWTGYLFVKYVK
jgi:hypothetical protein